MKTLYTCSFFLFILAPANSLLAQCTCSGGATPDSVVYYQYYDSIISTNTSIVFPQFNDTLGTLTCFRLSDTVTTVVNYNIENNLDTTEDYNFETYRRSQFTGPDGFFSSVISPPKDYGPYTLGPYDPTGTGDEVNVGPDTVFNKNAHTQYFGGTASYYGQGNVTLNYLTTSTFTILTGSDNAIIKLKAYTRLGAELVYYWCPFNVLESNLSAFSVSSNNNNILIKWNLNKQSSAENMIQMSTDGTNFTDLGFGVETASDSGINSQFVYVPDKGFTGSIYFRIKQTDYSGKVFYSEVKSIFINAQKSKISVYPNPTVSGVNIQFVNSPGSDYRVELINSYGQLLYLKNYSLNKESSVNINWPKKPTPGIYFLKVTDLNHHKEQVERLKIL